VVGILLFEQYVPALSDIVRFLDWVHTHDLRSSNGGEFQQYPSALGPLLSTVGANDPTILSEIEKVCCEKFRKFGRIPPILWKQPTHLWPW
jgi:hypothetical protein